MKLKDNKIVIEKDLVLLGAGHSNVEVLKKLGMKPIKGLRVTLISNRSLATYSGMVPAYIEGRYSWENINIDLYHLCNHFDHRLIVSEVTKIDKNKKLVYLYNRPPISYDILSVNMGIKSDYSNIIGAKNYALSLKPISEINITVNKIWDFNLKNPHNNIVLIGAGAAGVEVSLSIRNKLNSLNLNNQIILISRNNNILKNYGNRTKRIFKNILKKNKIEVLYNINIKSIHRNYILYNENSKIYCKFPILATSASPINAVKVSNLPLNKNGSIIIKNSLLVEKTNNIFATGDIAEIKKYKTPKAGVFAVKQGKILYKNIIRSLKKKKLINFYPQKSYLSLIGLPKKSALAEKSIISIKSKLFWYLKKYIDKRFIRKYSFKPEKVQKYYKIESSKNSMQCKGCGNKVSQKVLNNVFKKSISNGSLDADRVSNYNNLYLTTDIISSIVSDPFLLGKISAKHALNDIYAALSKPLSAQMIVSMPPALDTINERDLIQLKSGAKEILKEANCNLIGGHTYSTEDDQIYIGFSIIGKKKETKKQVSKRQKGNLYFTSKIGSALLFAGLNKKLLYSNHIQELISQMSCNNYDLFNILSSNNVDIITDVSGFGIAIHAYNLLLRYPHIKGLQIDLSKIPYFDGVYDLLTKNVRSSLSESNKSFIEKKLNIKVKNKNLLDLLYDPQTAGGFIFILNNNEMEILKKLSRSKINYTLIGKVKDTNRKIEII